jgi:hypothetical protein
MFNVFKLTEHVAVDPVVVEKMFMFDFFNGCLTDGVEDNCTFSLARILVYSTTLHFIIGLQVCTNMPSALRVCVV